MNNSMNPARPVLLAVSLFLTTVACASAQTYRGFAFAIEAPDQATAAAYHYKIVLDNTAAPLSLVSVGCGGVVSPWICSGNTPTLIPPGKHSVTLITFLPDETAQSDPTPPMTFSQGPATAINLAPKK